MAGQLVLALAQLNPTVGDISGNLSKVKKAWCEAEQHGASLVITPELFITGYPPEDFALKPALLKTVEDAVKGLARSTATGPAVLVGAPWVEEGRLYNTALLLEGGEIVAKVFKYDLPNYGPFDEKRVFASAPLGEPINFHGHRLGIMICEDMWKPDVANHLKEKGAQVLIVLNGSPYEGGKQEQRFELARERVKKTSQPLVYVNQVGGQDELVFEGASFVMNADGEVVAQSKHWVEELLLSRFSTRNNALVPDKADLWAHSDGDMGLYSALMTGLGDYTRKNRFDTVLLGLSGGVDSALVAAIAVDALGPEKVRAVMMPSRYTSPESLEDAAAVAHALGCRLDTVPINAAVEAFDETLAPVFAGCSPDVTEENIQARCRGIILMAMANKGGAMVLATGNKSEMATGYATLYGDMCGGYAPLKDVYKTAVYRLALWRNANKPEGALGPEGEVIPKRVLTKAPSAELRPEQTDQDTLPPYNVLDEILEGLIEDDLGVAEIEARGHDAALVQRVWSMLDRAEYKRRQAPPGPKVTKRHLTRDRRYPITNRYVEK